MKSLKCQVRKCKKSGLFLQSDEDRAELIELKSFCNNDVESTPLQGYLLLGLTTATSQTQSVVIDLIVNLWNFKTNMNGFFTIGGCHVIGTIDMGTTDHCVTYEK